MKKYVFESLKFFCAAILCTILTAFASPARAALPSGYTELSYIQTDGSAYIDTGILLSNTDVFEISFQSLNSLETPIMGAISGGTTYVSTSNLSVSYTEASGLSAYSVYCDGAAGNASYSWNGGNRADGLKHTIKYNGLNIAPTLDGVPMTQINTHTLTENNPTVTTWLFGRNNTSTGTLSQAGVRIYDVNIQGKGHFVPAKNTSGVVGMYDTVNNRFYTNAGTGEFIAGDPVATCDGTIVNYTSATGTGVQNGTPTPDNPIEPTFYKQGNMILRKVGDYADTYDASAGKITRRVGVKVLDGSEAWRVYSANAYATNPYFSTTVTNLLVGGTPDTKLFCNMLTSGNIGSSTIYKVQYTGGGFFVQPSNDMLTVENFKSWLVQQYSAGTPVTIYYPLAEETTEDWPASYCETPIKIATTKYNESAFSPLNTALQNAISVVDTVVSNTITQAGRIATLQAQKQTRPDETCPAGKKCLLVEDASGVPHWYEIVENASLLPNGYTELQYITFNGTQELDTGFTPNQDTRIESKIYGATNANMWIYGTGVSNPRITAYLAQSGNQRFGNKTVDSTGITGETLITIVQDKNVFNWNGNTKTYDSQSNFTALTSLAIGNSNGSTGTPYFSGNFYYMKIYDNEILVRDYVPAQDSNNNVGLFDRVNNVFLTAEGLVAGAIVE